jgi:hypothetical protein
MAFFYGFQQAWLEANPVGMIPPNGPRIERDQRPARND